MTNLRKAMYSLVVAGVTILAGGMSGSVAFADSTPAPTPPVAEVGPYNPPPAVYGSGPCNPMGIGTFYAVPEIPENVNEGVGPTANGPLAGNVMRGDVRILTQNNTSCSHAQVQFQLQSLFCQNILGYHKCDWKAVDKSDWQLLPVDGQLSDTVQAPCRKGANTYRTAALVEHVEADFEETPRGTWVPYLQTKNQEIDSDTYKVDCGA
jgi:hypothetical protein